MGYQKDVKEKNKNMIMQELASPRSFKELLEAVRPTIRSRSALTNNLGELKKAGLVERKIIEDRLVYALTEKGKSALERPEQYGGLSRRYFEDEIRRFIESSDEAFLKAYIDKLGVLILYSLIRDLETGGGWVEVSIPAVKDRLWLDHHIFSQAKVGGYGPKASDPKEVGKPFLEIRETPEKFKPQIDSLKASLIKLFPKEVSHIEKLWQIKP